METFLPIFNEQSEILVQILQSKFGQGIECPDIFPYVTKFALDVISGK